MYTSLSQSDCNANLAELSTLILVIIINIMAILIYEGCQVLSSQVYYQNIISIILYQRKKPELLNAVEMANVF